uniref:Uncharacterized protein n=1 Tax=Acrobeloides nanus TaxID=290746 RepID=A0A914CAT3_9BILA
MATSTGLVLAQTIAAGLEVKMSSLNNTEKGTKWTSIYIASLIAFIGSVQMSIFFNSLWPYLQILDNTATEEFFGYVVSFYSIGQIIAYPLFDLALLRTFVSNESKPEERAKVMAILTCGSAIGNSVGPGSLFLIYFCFNENSKNEVLKVKVCTKIGDSENPKIANYKKSQFWPGYDLIAVIVCYIAKFTQMFVSTNIETLGSSFAMLMFNWSNSDTVLYTSIAHAFLGGMNFLVYLAYIFFKFEKV